MLTAGLLALSLLAVTYAAASGQATSPSQPRRLHTALKACKKEKRKSRRQACEKKARTRYRTRPPTKTVTAHRPVTTAPEPELRQRPETRAEELERAQHPIPPAPTAGLVLTGAELFAPECGSCHGPHGEGTGGVPSLLNEPQPLTSTRVIEELISPTPGDMPNFDKSLTFIQKQSLADFVTVEVTRTEDEVE